MEPPVKTRGLDVWSWEDNVPGMRPHFSSKIADVKIFLPPGDSYCGNWLVVANSDVRMEFGDSIVALDHAKRLCVERQR